jgi:hypothetical protein
MKGGEVPDQLSDNQLLNKDSELLANLTLLDSWQSAW